jgi:hypothetical protein
MKPRNVAGPHHVAPSDPIRADELLPWIALHDRLGWGTEAVSEARRRGLRVLRFARRQYVLGRDIIEFLERVTDQDLSEGQDQNGQPHDLQSSVDLPPARKKPGSNGKMLREPLEI